MFWTDAFEAARRGSTAFDVRTLDGRRLRCRRTASGVALEVGDDAGCVEVMLGESTRRALWRWLERCGGPERGE